MITSYSGSLRGTRIGGGHVVTGRARVIAANAVTRSDALAGLVAGDIAVLHSFNPSWAPDVKRLRGVVCSSDCDAELVTVITCGSDLPVVAGVANIHTICDGDTIRLASDGQIEIFERFDTPYRVIAAE